MMIDNVKKIFAQFIAGESIKNNNWEISISDFLNNPIVGFKNAPDNPTKQDLHDIDGGIKGYAELIELGDYS